MNGGGEHRISNTEHRTSNAKHRTQNIELRTKNKEQNAALFKIEKAGTGFLRGTF